MVFYCISFITKKLFKNHFELYRGLFILLASITGFIALHFDVPFKSVIIRPLIISGLIYIGKLYSIYKNRIPLNPWIAFICFIGLIIAAILKRNINIGGSNYGNIFTFLLISNMGCYLVLVLAKIINKKKSYFKRIFILIGNNTLTIMALHFISFKIIHLTQIFIYNYPIKFLAFSPVIPKNIIYWWIPYTLIGVAIPLLIGILYDKIKHKII